MLFKKDDIVNCDMEELILYIIDGFTCVVYFFKYIKMSYYWFNRKDLLKKAHEKYQKEGGKEQAASYYQKDKEIITKKEREKYRIISREDNEKKKAY